MKNKVGYEEPRILKRKSCRSKTENKDREETSSIYQKLNKAFHVLRAKRPVHPDQEELEEQRRKVLKVFKEFIKEDQILKNFKLDQIGQNMDEDMEFKKNKGVEKRPQDMKAISSQETPAVSDDQAIYVETIASEPSGIQGKVPSQIQQSEPPSKAPSQMQTTDTQKTPSRLTQQPSEVMDKTSQKKKYDSIHLSDSTVLEELRVADQRAKNAAKMLESVKEHISKNAEKEEMTEEDIQLMQRKQAELMEKMSEFEEITKRVQQLVGLRDVSSSHLGLPSKPVLNRKSDKCVEELPKVIVCGPGMDQIPKIIVCEPAGKDKKPATVYETMEPVKGTQKKGVQYREEPHYRGQTPEDSMRQLVSTVQQTSQHYIQYSPPTSPQNFGYPEPFVYQNPPQYNFYGQVNHPVPKVNAEENEEYDFSPMDTEKQLKQLKDQENSLLELLKNIIQQKDLHLILVTEQYKSPIWETAQKKLNQLYVEHQKMLNDQVHLNIQQQQFYQSEYDKNLNSRAQNQVKRQIRRLQQHQKINSLMQQNVLKQMSIQEMLNKTHCSLRQLMEIYDSIQILQEQHQKLYEALFQQIVSQKEMLQSQINTERLVENHEKEIKMLKEEEKVAHRKNIEEHSSSRLKTMEDRSDGTIEEVSSLTELEEHISELRTITDKWEEKPKSDESYSINWNRSNFKFQLKRRYSESWAPENLVPLVLDRDSESSELSLTMSKRKHDKKEKKLEDEDFDHERLQYLVRENIERQKVHEVLRQVLCTVSERLDIGLKHQRLQQEKTKALIFKNIEQQQHLQDNLLHKVVTPQQKFVIQSRILHLYTLLQQLLQQQQCEEKQIERFEKNQTLLEQLIKKNEKHMGQLLHSLKCHQLSILDYINYKGSELKKKILSKSLSLTQEKQSRAKLFKLHQIHSKIVVQLHSQQARLQPPEEQRVKNLEQIIPKKNREAEKFIKRDKNVATKKDRKRFEGLSMLNGLVFEKKDMHLDEIQKKIAYIQKEKKKLNQNEKEETDNEISQYVLLKDKIKTEEVDNAISKLGRLQSTIGFLKDHTTLRKQQYDVQQPFGNVQQYGNQQYGNFPEGYNEVDPYDTELGDQTSVEQAFDDVQRKQREQMEPNKSQTFADKQTTYTEPLQRTEGAMCRAEVYQNLGLPIPPGVNPNCPAALLNSLMGGMPGNNVICKADLWKAMKKGGGTCVPNCPGAQGMGDVPPGVCKKRMKSQKWKKEKNDMDSIVKSMEEEVRSIQKELELVQAERRGLDLQKKLLSCATAGPTAPTAPGQMPSHISKPVGPKPIPQMPAYKGGNESLSALECQLSTLREKYKKLQEDYNNKVEEISMVRVEFNAAKRDNMALLEKSEEAEARADDLLERLKAAEDEKIKVVGSKDQMMEMEQKMVFAQQRYREGQEEIEEMRTNMQDLMLQLEDYRNKYLNAQQTVEEQRRQLDIMELENNRIGEQVNLEIQRVKTQFQEKLQELTPLPDMLKATQMKLQETQQLRIIAERTVEQMKKEMDELKEKHEAVNEELEGYKKDTTNLDAEKVHLKNSLTTGEKRIEEIKAENAKLRATLARLEEVTLKNERRFDEKNHETIQLQTQLETLREESARQVARTKDRCETVRRSLQSQISELERQLAQSRAAARTAQKDRDEIRQKMQAQITSLNDNFEQAQLRIRSLQSHVNYLKNSYTNLFSSDQSNIPILDKKSS